MDLVVVTPPTTEPVSVGEARDYLRVTSTTEDVLIGRLVTAARLRVEQTTGYAIGEQVRRLTLDAWPQGGVLPLPTPPVHSVDEVTVTGPSLTPEPFADYEAVTGIGALVAGRTWPAVGVARGGVSVTYTCGLGTASHPVPETLRVAVLALVLHWYDHRGTTAVGTITSDIPQTYDFLTGSHRFRYRLP